ncbi:MAG: hypothetical protein C5B54_05565 [Acidobacteria bacterium]|nr:MAG: hypothetical protein C5B54_05565 [Acidobacteriota bacterium]
MKNKNSASPYRSLNKGHIIETTKTLWKRISERFPDSGLSRVCNELVVIAEQSAKISEWIDRPNLWLKAAAGVFLLSLFSLVLGMFIHIRPDFSLHSISDLLQTIEAGVNDVIFLGLAILFFVTWEKRLKRKRALAALHELRSLAHIIDMHQLTKDPERLLEGGSRTASSPARNMTAFELTRYLDYCSEMLAIISKIAAVYVEKFDDDVTLAAVNELESLTTGLAGKIWQKIMILDVVFAKTSEETL